MKTDGIAHRAISAPLTCALRFVADTLFPKACVSCGAPDTYFCERCLDALPRKREYGCPVCHAVKTPDGATCLSCRKRSPLDGVFAAAVFRETPVLAEAVHALKYEFVPDIAEPLGTFLADRVRDTELPIPDLIIPVPLHPWRLRYRGFNQSTLIARSFVKSFIPDYPLPVRDDLITRNRFTLPQAKSRDAKERRENLRNAFALYPKNPDARKDVKGRVVWLIDDVATTGSTLAECAKVLKKAGSRTVYGIVVAQ